MKTKLARTRHVFADWPAGRLLQMELQNGRDTPLPPPPPSTVDPAPLDSEGEAEEEEEEERFESAIMDGLAREEEREQEMERRHQTILQDEEVQS